MFPCISKLQFWSECILLKCSVCNKEYFSIHCYQKIQFLSDSDHFWNSPLIAVTSCCSLLESAYTEQTGWKVAVGVFLLISCHNSIYTAELSRPAWPLSGPNLPQASNSKCLKRKREWISKWWTASSDSNEKEMVKSCSAEGRRKGHTDILLNVLDNPVVLFIIISLHF